MSIMRLLPFFPIAWPVVVQEIANGLLGALVAITATCACVHPHEAVIIGFIGAIAALGGNDVLEYRFKIDDPAAELTGPCFVFCI